MTTRPIYTPIGATFAGEDGQPITETGRTVTYNEFYANKLRLGFVRTDNARNYPVIDQQSVALQIAASFPTMTASITIGVGVALSVSAYFPTMTASATLTVTDGAEGLLVDSLGNLITDSFGNLLR